MVKKLPISLAAFHLQENTLETNICWNVKVPFWKQIDFFKPVWFQTPEDSSINQRLPIVHEIYKSFDAEFEVRSVFLDIWKMFDKVWHKGIIFRLKQKGISGKLISILSDFFKERKQGVTFNGRVSSWTGINTRVTQGYNLGPLLVLAYNKELTNSLWSNTKLFADDTFLFFGNQ